MVLVKPCIYCGVSVVIDQREEDQYRRYGVNLHTAKFSCSKCDDRKLQPIPAEDS